MRIDLSHTIEHGMITYKGLPAPIVCDFLTREASKQKYAEGTTFHMGKIEMISNTGTYVDAPFHRYEQGMDLSSLVPAVPAGDCESRCSTVKINRPPGCIAPAAAASASVRSPK